MVLAHNIDNVQRTNDVKITLDVTFDSMLLSSDVLQGLKSSGFYKPSPIQLHGIPLGKCGFDLLLDAKSGTGKTAVFAVIALEILDLSKGLQVIILAPTREIAAQICDALKQIGQNFEGLQVEVVMGGLPIQDDINKFKNNVHIVVGSPGRLKHLISDNHIDLKSVRLFVLDEADKLMEKSFLKDIKYINAALPKQKQVIMSSATYPESSKEFIYQFVHDAQHICPSSNCILQGVAQKVTYVKHNGNIVKKTQNRFQELLKILTKKPFKQCLIFCNYQARVGELHKMLSKKEWPVEQLYGQQEQTDRLNSLQTLKQYKCRILVSTDLAARGIDASNVDLVINFEPPYDWPTYLHRVGRAGRYGSYGVAVTILSEGAEKRKFVNLLQSICTSIDLTPLWSEDTVDEDDVDNKIKTCTQNINNVMSNDEDNKLRGDICYDTEALNLNVESFSNLLKSFGEVKNYNIESFSDLLTSYQNYSCETVETPLLYKNIKIPNLEDIQHLGQKLHLVKTHNENLFKDSSDNSDCADNSQDDITNFEDFQDREEKSQSSVIVNINNQRKTNKLSNDFKENSQTLESKIDDASFISEKKEEKEINNIGQNVHSNVKNKKANECSSHQFKECSSKLVENVNNPFSTKQLNIHESKTHSSKKAIKSTNLDNFYSNTEYSTNDAYKNWYSNLKLQAKQIELLMYVEELKLNK